MSNKYLHLAYLKSKGDFQIKCSIAIFSVDELKILKSYGHWFAGLCSGKLIPFNKEQKHFVKVFKKDKKPVTIYEKIWFKYLGRLALEKQNPNLSKLNYKFKEQSFYTREDYFKLHPDKRNRFS